MIEFRSAIAKIERAGSQIEKLNVDAEELCRKIRQSIVCETDNKADEKRWVYRGESPIVPMSWSVRTGEILYNLRSALDHLVWQLVCANGQTPTTDNQFPIADDVDAWKRSSTRRSLKGISDGAKQAIQYLQPFNPWLDLPTNGAVHPFDAQTFRTLRNLCNIDKHRHLHLIIARTDGIGPVEFGENQPPRRPTRRLLTGKGNPGAIEKDMLLFWIDDSKQALNPVFQIGIKFDSRQMTELVVETVPDFLRRCLEAVRGAERLLWHYNDS